MRTILFTAFTLSLMLVASPALAGGSADISGTVVGADIVSGAEACPGTGAQSVQLTVSYSSLGRMWSVNMLFKEGLVCAALDIAAHFANGGDPVITVHAYLYSNVYGNLVAIPASLECLADCPQ